MEQSYAILNKRQRVVWWLTHPSAFFWRIAGEVYKWRNPDMPWISHQSIRFCEATLKPTMNALEWGSGRSTLWFAPRLRKLTSVEHEQNWHKIVSEKLLAQKVLNVEYRHIPLDHPVEAPAYTDYSPMPEYVRVADDFENDCLDFVLVDGHYRQACIKVVIPKIKSGGLLMVDNSNWMPLHEWGVPNHWTVEHRSMGYEGETTVWRKPLL